MKSSASTPPPEHQRYNALLQNARGFESWMRQLSDAAYAIANTESVGPAAKLRRLADAAGAFADAISRSKDL